jgi:hypothetical protein
MRVASHVERRPAKLFAAGQHVPQCFAEADDGHWFRHVTSSGFASRCKSRFFIAELLGFATPSTSQVLERQDVRLVRLLQLDVSFAFGEMNFGANAGRSLAEGCLAER